MDDKTFRIDSRQDAETFQDFLNRYCERVCGLGSATIPAGLLSALFSFSRNHEPGGKLLAAVVDLELTYLFMQRDSHAAAGVWNTVFSPAKSQPTSVLDRFDTFSGKVDILYNFTSFSMRCRSFWDKLMGILFLMYDSDNYERFLKARSRKGFFDRKARSWQTVSPHIRQCLIKEYHNILSLAAKRGIPDHGMGNSSSSILGEVMPVFPQQLVRIIDSLDEIRTAEAHGTGALRKWSLAMLPLHESKDFGLLNHWNIANSFMHHLRRALGDLAQTT